MKNKLFTKGRTAIAMLLALLISLFPAFPAYAQGNVLSEELLVEEAEDLHDDDADGQDGWMIFSGLMLTAGIMSPTAMILLTGMITCFLLLPANLTALMILLSTR